MGFPLREGVMGFSLGGGGGCDGEKTSMVFLVFFLFLFVP